MEFKILGPIGACSSGEEISLHGAKQRTVLAALLLNRQRLVSDSRLGELLWGESLPATFSAQIYTYVSRLRKCLGKAVEIVRRPPGYLLHLQNCEFDLISFEQMACAGAASLAAGRYQEAARTLHRALACWQGPAVANGTEHLIEAEGPALEEARMAALQNRIRADLRLGRYAQLVPELTALVTVDPFREQLRADLMTVLYKCDRQADALNVFHEGRRLLRDEMGADPGATLTRVYHSILDGGLPAGSLTRAAR
jgi:DNA-binding SARP family transcriptional activator